MTETTVEVFYSQTCPKCPAQRKLAKQFSDRDDVKVKLTDVARNQKRAQNHGVRAVPTTVVDGPMMEQKTGFRGVTSEERLETAIEVAKGEKDPEELQNPGIIQKVRDILR